MIAVDSDILIYAHRMDSSGYVKASVAMEKLIKGTVAWAIPWVCVSEFITIVTQEKPYSPPSTMEQCFRALDKWRRSESLQMLSESPGHYEKFQRMVIGGKIDHSNLGKAKLAALCINHGVTELWTGNIEDYASFPGLNCINPLEK